MSTAPSPVPSAGQPTEPPGIDEYLERVRTGLARLEPRAAYEAASLADFETSANGETSVTPETSANAETNGFVEPALLVDIRYQALRERDGTIPGALIVERNELEWRLDPQGSHRLAEATGHHRLVVVICNEGYASSLAAASLHQLGLHRATDLVGGFQAWRTAGLPVVPSATDS